ncbi:MAG: hypothetical protein J7M30_07960 [Deltaproteobacteria bacterium]|nr:hypothetical protein [Deltaproteobacteria bacterium]
MAKLDKLMTKVAKVFPEGTQEGQINSGIPPKVLACSLPGMIRIYAVSADGKQIGGPKIKIPYIKTG